jgi:hypothetical protein
MSNGATTQSSTRYLYAQNPTNPLLPPRFVGEIRHRPVDGSLKGEPGTTYYYWILHNTNGSQVINSSSDPNRSVNGVNYSMEAYRPTWPFTAYVTAFDNGANSSTTSGVFTMGLSNDPTKTMVVSTNSPGSFNRY